ncbi:MAG: hypothetical protein KAI66_24335, partial [Lentisphaeria bacterium]|nr:hypothetical protein [Lentisphaeria bacterium]
MIEPMTEATIVCLAEARNATVAELRDLGIVHVKPVQAPASEELDELSRRRDRYARALGILSARDPGTPSSIEPSGADREAHDPEYIAEQVLRASQELNHAEERLVHWSRVEEELAPWGSFSSETLAALQRGGLRVSLCAALETERPELPAGVVARDLSRTGKRVFFVVIAPGELELQLPEVPLPELTDHRENAQRLDECKTLLASKEAVLASLQVYEPVLSGALAQFDEELEF